MTAYHAHACLAALGVGSVTACSGGPPARSPDAAVFVQVGPGQSGTGADAVTCSIPFAIPVGASDADAYLPSAAVGDLGAHGPTHVRCSVRPTGDTFAVDARLSLDPDTAFSITGTMNRASADALATFAHDGVTWNAEAPCLVDFTFAGGMDVAPGRVWAVVMCPRASDGQGHTCFASAEFVFENCAE